VTSAVDNILRSLDTDPRKVRVEYRGRDFTGADLRGRINARAADLHKAGLRPGDRVLIVVSENLGAAEQLIASWTLGASGLLVDFRASRARIDEWRQRLSPALTIGQRKVDGLDLHLQPRDPVPAATPLTGIDIPPDSAALMMTSSGTTGVPSLHHYSHARLAHVLEVMNNRPKVIKDGAGLSSVSAGFSASCAMWLRYLLGGQKIIALDLVHSITELDSALQREDVVTAMLPPSTIRRLLAVPSEKTPRYPQIRKLLSVGGPGRPEDKIAAVTRLSPMFCMGYSCTGVGEIAAISGLEILKRPESCGKPEPDVDLEIRDGSRLCGIDEIGEIEVNSQGKARFRPGDLGRLDADGYLYVTGRVQGLLSRNGVNFSAEKLVAAALAFPHVLDAGVAAIKDQDDGDEVHLFVQVGPVIAPALRAALEDHLRQTIPTAEYPNRVHLCPDLPMTAGGKVDIQALVQQLKEAGIDVLQG
jgi:acyl-coenzyme A synthetase/AMP-(fatty) acid ligase